MASSYGPVLLLPGFMGSQLVRDGGPSNGKVLWADALSVAKPGTALGMLLDADGTSPFPDWGIPLKPHGFVAPYYTAWEGILQGQRAKFKFGPVEQIAWDWRKKFEESVDLVYARFTSLWNEDGRVNIVAHSAGGMLARLLYAKLVDAGQEERMRRIITCGTPHRGSFDAVSSLAGRESFYNSWQWRALLGTPALALESPYGRALNTSEFWTVLGGSWPGLYELLPRVDETTEEGRALADRIYSNLNYPYRGLVKQPWFDWARKNFWPRIVARNYILPAAQTWCLIGTGIGTRSAFSNAAGRINDEAFNPPKNSDGDGVVTKADQVVANCTRRANAADHRAEPTGFAETEMIARAITEDSDIGGTTVITKNLITTPSAQAGPLGKGTLIDPKTDPLTGDYPAARGNVGDP